MESDTSVDDIVPQMIMNVMDQKLGLIGHLVVDTTVNGCSIGGVRILPDVTLHELRYLARNMTLKYGFWGIPKGGAKSCVLANPSWSMKIRLEILKTFGSIIGPLIKCGLYFPGPDMGASDLDVRRIYGGASYDLKVKSFKTHLYASWTLLVSARVAAENIGVDLSSSSVAIEGFGSIGVAAAHAFSRAGARIVAVSTIDGAIYDPEGLDVSHLVELKGRFGDAFVNECNTEQAEKSSLSQLPVDVFVPCARFWSINASNVKKVKAKIVCPGANLPMSNEVESLLHRRGILCVPDFVANSGGAFGGYVESFAGEDKIRSIIDRDFGKKVRDILGASCERKAPPGQVARESAFKGFEKTKHAAEKDIVQKGAVRKLFNSLPKPVRNRLAPFYLRRRWIEK